jgi:hypothetical protein
MPTLHKHGLVPIRGLDIDRPCLDRRKSTRDIINHLDNSSIVFASEMGLKVRNHLFLCLIVVVQNICHITIIWNDGDHKLKKGVPWINHIVKFDKTSLSKLVRGTDMLAFPAVKPVDIVTGKVMGDLISSVGLQKY